MRDILEKIMKFAGEPEQKPGDQVRGTEKATKGDKHPFLKRLVGELKKPKTRNIEKELAEEWSMFQEEDLGVEPRRPARVGSREEKHGRRGHKEIPRYRSVKEQMPQAPIKPGATTAASGTTPGQNPVDPAAAAAIKKSLDKLKSSVPGIDVAKATTTIAKADSNVNLNPVDQANISKMAPQLANVMKNPQMAGQLKMMIDKANQQEIAQTKQQGTQE